MHASQFDKWLEDPARPPLIMGVLNLTPDSFSDGGLYSTPEAATDAALAMFTAGADVIDLGGESTRPGALPIPPDEQIRRILPTLMLIRRRTDQMLSIDTTHWSVADPAIDEGVNLINDTSAGCDDLHMLPQVAAAGLPMVLMHRLAEPRTMQNNPTYSDVTAEVTAFLTQRRDAAIAAGIKKNKILFDPGLGFGKTVDHNLTLLRNTSALAALGQPLVVGPGRKSFIGKVLNEPDPKARIYGEAAVISWLVANGASLLRVHDVGPLAQVLKMTLAIKTV